MRKFDGTPIADFPLGDPSDPSLAIYRAKLHAVLFEYARDLGIEIEFSATVSEYFEKDEQGGVVLSDGRRLTADVVVAADGVGSRSWELVVGSRDPPISSGFVMYRVTFRVASALENPVIAAELAGYKHRAFLYAGAGAHMVICKSGEDVCWLLTRREDSNTAEESWTSSTSINKALDAVQGWDEFVTELIEATPNHTVLDWKLMWRNPQPRSASPGGRVVQIGGRKAVPIATKVHNHLRFERVSCAQKMGFKNRELFHNTDWDAVAKDPQILGKMVGNWVVHHDPEQYAYENYANCADHLLHGAPFENTNCVPGYTYKPWTARELLDAADRGESVVDDGDWS